MGLSPGYLRYLKSPAWMSKRKEVMKRADYECEVCGVSNKPLQTHHLHYRNIFNERLEDLLCSCKSCHKYLDRIRKLMKAIEDSEDYNRIEPMCQVLEKIGFPHDLNWDDRKPLIDLERYLETLAP